MSSSKLQNRPQAYMWTDDRTGLISISSPYHKAFVEELKLNIPSNARHWKKEEKVWEVDPTWLSTLKKVAELFFDIEEHKNVSALENSLDDPYSIMLKLASDEALRKVYFVLVEDVNQRRNNQEMEVLVEAFRQISEEREM